MATIFSFDQIYNEHSAHYQTIVSICNIINLDVDYVSPSCLLSDGVWTYTYGFYLLLIVPFIPFLLAGILSGCAWLWQRHVGKRDMFSIHLPVMCSREKHVTSYALSCLREAIPFVGVVYNNVCLKSFNTFSCIALRDGREVLSVAPSIVCWESQEHNVMVGISILALIVYVFGFPFVTFAVTYYGRRRDLLRHPSFLATVGLFYREYESKYFYWDLIFLARRFFLCLCAVVFRGRPFTQSGVAILIIATCILLQFVHRPYWDYYVDYLDCMCALSILLHCIASLYYNDLAFTTSPTFSKDAAGLDILLVAVNSLCFIAILALFIRQLCMKLLARRVFDAVAEKVVHHVISMQLALRKNSDKVISQLSTMSNEKHGEERMFAADFSKFIEQALDGSGVASSPVGSRNLFTILKLVGAGIDVLSEVETHDDLELLTAKLTEEEEENYITFETIRQFIEVAGASASPSVSLDSPVAAAKTERRASVSIQLSHHQSVKQLVSGKQKADSWSKIILYKMVRKVAWEPIQSFSPMALHHWLKANENNNLSIMSLFNVSSAIRMYVPDTAEVGAYSNSAIAKTYDEVTLSARASSTSHCGVRACIITIMPAFCWTDEDASCRPQVLCPTLSSCRLLEIPQ
jgi:hypothetical protein